MRISDWSSDVCSSDLLFDNCRILQRRDVLCDLLTFADRAQQATHDLAGARLRQVVGKADLVGLGERADFAADVFAQFLRQLLRVGATRPIAATDHERQYALALDLMRAAHDGGLRDGRMTD